MYLMCGHGKIQLVFPNQNRVVLAHSGGASAAVEGTVCRTAGGVGTILNRIIDRVARHRNAVSRNVYRGSGRIGYAHLLILSCGGKVIIQRTKLRWNGRRNNGLILGG